jgi:Protein of unknown function (DUF1254)
MVFEAPPGLQGILLDFWQRPIPGPTIGGNAFFGDIGFAGPDGGKGGKFLILPPGYDNPVPDGLAGLSRRQRAEADRTVSPGRPLRFVRPWRVGEDAGLSGFTGRITRSPGGTAFTVQPTR